VEIVWFTLNVTKQFVFFEKEKDMAVEAAMCVAVGVVRACLEGVCMFRKYKK
jgi:hypothetical protein